MQKNQKESDTCSQKKKKGNVICHSQNCGLLFQVKPIQLFFLATIFLCALSNMKAHAFGPTECAGQRFGSDLGCTAADVSITGISVSGGGSTSCIGGTNVSLDLDLTVEFANPNRYDVGIFISNDGKNPELTTANGGPSSCSVGILPTVPPFKDLDSDVCGDGNNSLIGVLQMNNVTVSCRSLSGSSGNLYIPFVVSWDQKSTNPCTSIADPVPGTKSKCNAPTVLQGSVSVVVLPSITKTDGTTTTSPGFNNIYTVAITNTTGDILNNAVFTDPAIANITVNSLTCSSTGGASCPASPTVADMQGAGITIPAMPVDSSVTFIIDTTVDSAYLGTITNTAYVSVGGETNSASDSTDSVPDTTPPTISSMIGSCATMNEFTVTFSENVDTTTAETITNYSLDNGITITGTALTASDTVTLTTSALTNSTTYTLTVNNVEDLAGNPIIAGSTISYLLNCATICNFRDNFSSALYSNDDGSQLWSTNWTESNDDGSATSGDAYISGDNLILHNRTGKNSTKPILTRELDLSLATSATLEFLFSSVAGGNGDKFEVEISGDGGASWNSLGTISNAVSPAQLYSYPLGNTYFSTNTQIRLSINGGYRDVNEEVHIDYIEVLPVGVCGGSGVDHFDIDHDGAGINCLAEPITVTAEDSGNSTFTSYTGTITLNTQTTYGTWSLASGSGTFTDATANDGLATYTYVAADNGVAIFNLNYLDGTSPVNILVTDGTVNDDNLEGNITFSPSGFTVTASALSNPPPSPINDPIASQTAGTNFTLNITAFGQTPTDPTCGVIETYTGGKNIKFWFDYDDPGSGTIPVTIDANPISTDELVSVAQAVTFTNGQANVIAKYKDVGQIQISMKDDTIAEPVGGIIGASNLFVVKPADFVLTNIIRTSDSFANPGAADETGTVFINAGGDFTVTVTVNDSEGDPAPNFGQESAPETILLNPTIVAAGGANNPAIQSTTGFDFTPANGTATGTDFNWPEVGIITLTPQIGDLNYLGAGDVIGTVSGNVGRFIPDHLIMTSNSITPFCNGFTYMDQSITDISITIQAQNTANAVTVNYDGVFAMANFNLTAENANNGVNLAGRLSSLPSPLTNWGGGQYIVNTNTAVFNKDVTEDGPFDNLAIGLIIANNEAALSGGYDMNPDTNTDCVALANCTAKTIGTTKTRYGRSVALNANGPEIDPLTLSIFTEYYDVTGNWTINLDDDCTQTDFTKTENGITVTEAPLAPPGPITTTNGQADIILTPSADPAPPGGTVIIDYDFPSWLEPDLSATATFGIYKGNDRIINWREIFR